MDDVKTLLEKDKLLKHLKHDSLATLFIKKQWNKIAGKVLAKQLKVSYVRGSLLVLGITNPCWYTEIDFYKESLLTQVNQVLGSKKEIKWLKLIMETDVDKKELS